MVTVSAWKELAFLVLASNAFYCGVSAWSGSVGWQITSHLRNWRSFACRSSHSLFASDSPSNYGNNNLSASSQERREEEKRRRQRQNDVVVGKTSALRDATDYPLNPKSTEQEWMRQASREEQLIFRYTEEGLEALKMLKLEEADRAFNEIFKIKPGAYLWQSGIAKFYLGDLEGAAAIFAKNAAIYETKFGAPASEERIWRQACELKLISQMEKRDREKEENRRKISSKLTQISDLKVDPESLFAETRKAIRIAGDLFNASVNNDHSGVILARAKLRSIGGNFDDIPRLDIKMWKMNAWFYLGLHYDSVGEINESKECMKMALRNCPNTGNGDDIIYILPLLHMSRRDWFDDDDVDTDPLQLLGQSPEKSKPSETDEMGAVANRVTADPLFVDSVWKSISKMRVHELQEALRVRGFKIVGSKEEVQKRFFWSLMDDAGLFA